jgi:hypothetical protein
LLVREEFFRDKKLVIIAHLAVLQPRHALRQGGLHIVAAVVRAAVVIVFVRKILAAGARECLRRIIRFLFCFVCPGEKCSVSIALYTLTHLGFLRQRGGQESEKEDGNEWRKTAQ